MAAFGTNNLGIWKFHVDWTTPANTTFTGPTLLPVPAFTDACNDGTCIPQGGTSQQLDSLGDRLMNRLAYRNFGDHESLVVNHSVKAGTSVGIRWYELRPSAGALTVFQQGTYAPDSNYRWMGSIAQDRDGNMGLGFSLSGPSLHPQIHYTGRLAGDPAGQMTQGEGTIVNGAGSQTGSSLSRWGDYSSMSVDPVDDCTFWYTNEYIPSDGAFNWKTRIGSFKFPGCGAAPVVTNDFSLSASPATLSASAGDAATSTISTAVTAGVAESVALSLGGAPPGLTASFSPTTVAAGGSSTLTLDTTGVAPGTYALTVTGTAASATHTASVALTVIPNDFALSASPASLSVAVGQSANVSIDTTVTSGAARAVALALSGAPAGVTGAFSSASVLAGGSSTLTLSAAVSAAPGSYTLTVTGTSASATHSADVALTVVVPPPVVSAGPDVSGVEGAAIPLGGSATGSRPVTSVWSYQAGANVDANTTCAFADPAAPVTTFRCTDDGTFVVVLTARDGVNAPVSAQATVTVNNAAPTVTITSPAPGALVKTGDSVTLTSSFADAGANDTHTCSIDWGDAVAAGTVNEAAGTCSGTHAYAASGARVVRATVTDDDGASGSDTVGLTVADARVSVLAGGLFGTGAARAAFAFDARTAPGAATPTGLFGLSVPAARFVFESHTFSSLVGVGDTATLRGVGAVNGASGFTFTATAVDGAPDRIRIVVRRTATDAVVYDSGGPVALALGLVVIRH